MLMLGPDNRPNIFWLSEKEKHFVKRIPTLIWIIHIEFKSIVRTSLMEKTIRKDLK